MRFIAKEGLEEVYHGLYVNSEAWQDELFELQYDLNKLLSYAQKMNIEDKVRTYTEVLA